MLFNDIITQVDVSTTKNLRAPGLSSRQEDQWDIKRRRRDLNDLYFDTILPLPHPTIPPFPFPTRLSPHPLIPLLGLGGGSLRLAEGQGASERLPGRTALGRLLDVPQSPLRGLLLERLLLARALLLPVDASRLFLRQKASCVALLRLRASLEESGCRQHNGASRRGRRAVDLTDLADVVVSIVLVLRTL